MNTIVAIKVDGFANILDKNQKINYYIFIEDTGIILVFRTLKKESAMKLWRITIVCSIIFSANIIFANDNPELFQNIPPPISGAAVPDPTPILTKIQQAKELAMKDYMRYENALRALREITNKTAPTNGKKSKNRYSVNEKLEILPTLQSIIREYRLETRLYILDQRDGTIHTLDYDERMGFPLETNGCLIEENGGQGHNMNLLVYCEDHGVMPVLALAHFHKQPKDTPHVYVPYSRSLHTKETVEAGKLYLRQTIDGAFSELTRKQTQSRAFPGKLVTEQFPKHFVEAVLIVEHIDHKEFEQALALDSEGEETRESDKRAVGYLIEKVYVTDGINGPDSKKFSISNRDKKIKWQACCRAQFIRGTHKMITVDEYPEAALNSNFLEGMRDHLNAFQETVLLFDSDMSKFSNETRTLCTSSKDILLDCLAAAYNGGVGNLNNVIHAFKENWDKQKALKKGKRFLRKGLKPETVTYIAKIRAVRAYLDSEEASKTSKEKS